MSSLVVIPARWNSVRLPGKPLAVIAGRTLLERAVDVGRRAIAGLDAELLVATDDHRIADQAAALGCAVVVTDPEIRTGSGRALAAASARVPQPAHICSFQGDSPFIPAEAIRLVLRRLDRADCDCVTPVTRLDWQALDAFRRHKQRSPSSGTTCVRAPDGRALWFSKAVLPQLRDEDRLRAADPLSPVFRHLGLYGYTLEALSRFEAAPPSCNEQLEGLEQLRLLELGMVVQTVMIEPGLIAMSGIDTADDVAMAERLIAMHGDPFGR